MRFYSGLYKTITYLKGETSINPFYVLHSQKSPFFLKKIFTSTKLAGDTLASH